MPVLLKLPPPSRYCTSTPFCRWFVGLARKLSHCAICLFKHCITATTTLLARLKGWRVRSPVDGLAAPALCLLLATLLFSPRALHSIIFLAAPCPRAPPLPHGSASPLSPVISVISVTLCTTAIGWIYTR
jgi:hypothetical protein